ncbi:monooxygenase [Seminavis robusta]|uniref:Monooxygenase n=1 Tax=Seminavis robusta TaxID=568900 RepID=A0A9N8HU46_9STRA|nr:monooxygenase [Seminavis robusta]|eukprot:Sro1345_g264790.1 monooxygenase (638) ;mRNA; f:17425-19338
MDKRAVVIGGGPSGLAMTKELNQVGFEVACFDNGKAIGGVWDWAWDSLVMTSSSTMSAFSDYPSKDEKMWSKKECNDYLNSYVDHFGIRSLIHVNQAVIKATRVRNQQDDYWYWQVTTRHNETGQETLHEAGSLFVCTGNNHVPRMVNFEGIETYQGDMMHTKEYTGDHSIFANKDILTVGMGESGADLSLAAAKVAKSCQMSIRNSSGWVGPRLRKGIPADYMTSRILWGIPRVAAPIQSLLMSTGDKTFGETKILKTMGEYNRGVVTKCNPLGAWGTHGTKSTGFIEAIVNHGATIVPGISRVGPKKRVEFTDGSISNHVDMIVLNTGFLQDFEFLQPDPEDHEFIASVEAMRQLHLWKRTLPLNFDQTRLGFIGVFFRPTFGSQLPSAEMQARVASAALLEVSGRQDLAHIPVLPRSREAMRLQIVLGVQQSCSQYADDASNKKIGDFYLYMNDMAITLGVHPGTFWEILFRDPALALCLFWGCFSAPQFRLKGRMATPEVARDAIVRKIHPAWFLSARLYRIAIVTRLVSALLFTVVAILDFVTFGAIESIRVMKRTLQTPGTTVALNDLSVSELEKEIRVNERIWSTASFVARACQPRNGNAAHNDCNASSCNHPDTKILDASGLKPMKISV